MSQPTTSRGKYSSIAKVPPKRSHHSVDPKTPSPNPDRTVSKTPKIDDSANFLLQIKESLREVVKEEVKDDLSIIKSSLEDLTSKYQSVKLELETLKESSETEILELKYSLEIQKKKEH